MQCDTEKIYYYFHDAFWLKMKYFLCHFNSNISLGIHCGMYIVYNSYNKYILIYIYLEEDVFYLK